MEHPSIYTITMMIRGFSNEVTVKGLAAQLGISYSTLARCKNGVWPPSITFEAVYATLLDCRDHFFGGSDDAMTQAMLRYLRLNGIETQDLEKIYAQEGFENFITELLHWAADPEKYTVRAISAQERKEEVPEGTLLFASDTAEGEQRTQDEKPPEPTSPAEDLSRMIANKQQAEGATYVSGFAANVTSVYVSAAGQSSLAWDKIHLAMTILYAVIPVFAILFLGLYGVRYDVFLLWAGAHRVSFLVLSLFIALLPPVLAVSVDARLAWGAYKKAHPQARYSWHDFAVVAKYGDVDEVIPGAGRADIFWQRTSYQSLCNILGALVYVSLLVFLNSLPQFESFLAVRNWTEFFKVGIVLGFLTSYEQLRGLIAQPRPASCDTLMENPDNYLPTRAHVWANTFHLAWSISMSSTLLLCLIGYSLSNFRTIEAPTLMLLPIYCAMLFYAHAYASPYAIESQCTDGGAFVPCVVATSLGFIALISCCYLPSWKGMLICAACVASVVWALLWQRNIVSTENAVWLEQGKHASSYSVYFVIALVVMVATGILTSAFL